MKTIVVPVCKKHPKYNAVLHPRTDCIACFALFYLRHQA